MLKLNFYLKILVLKSWTFMSYHKNSFSNDFAKKKKKKSRIFQNFCLFEIQPIEFVFRPIELWREKMAFSFKGLGFPRFLPNSSWPIEPVFMWFSIPARFLSIDWISNFKNKKELDLTFSKVLFLSISSIPLMIPLLNFFFWSFLWSKLQRFSSSN